MGMTHCKDCGMPLDGSDPNPLRMVWAALKLRLWLELKLFGCGVRLRKPPIFRPAPHCARLIERYTFDPDSTGTTKH